MKKTYYGKIDPPIRFGAGEERLISVTLERSTEPCGACHASGWEVQFVRACELCAGTGVTFPAREER